MTIGSNSTFIDRVRAVVDEPGIIVAPEAMQPYLISWRDNWVGRAMAIVRPTETSQVAQIVSLCRELSVPLVPQGGRTGVTGASQPGDRGDEIVLSLERMRAIRAIDTENDTMTVEAGCVLADIRDAAERAGRIFPLSFGAVGSCQIGGNIATNAGGVNVVRYGNTRNLVAGLEVVLPDGQVWDGLRGLRKDNAGYDLKQLFIGSEGTLGIITAAVVRLFPRPLGTAVAFAATPSPRHGLNVLMRMRERFAEQLTAFELIEQRCIDVTCRRIPGLRAPLAEPSPWYLLIEIAGQDRDDATQAALADVLGAMIESGDVTDATLAQSRQQEQDFWRLRESIPEAHKHEGRSFKHDISVPVSRIPEFLERAEPALRRIDPDLLMFTFGHLGDGNLHFNPLLPPGREPFAGELQIVNSTVHDLVSELAGSISAEHGIGRLRREELTHYKSDIELRMMATLKRAFDPENLFNRGKILGEDILAAALAEPNAAGRRGAAGIRLSETG